MIDFIKIWDIPLSVEDLKNNSFLSFTGRYNPQTGQIWDLPLFAEYRGLTFRINDNSEQRGKFINKGTPEPRYKIYINLYGSLHKYLNQGEHNYNDFSFKNLITTIQDLYSKFGINPLTAIIHSLEFGLNLCIPFPAGEFLRSLINHRGEPFRLSISEREHLYKCTKQQFELKLYDKGLQYDIEGWNILRVEVKTTKMKHLEKYNIRFLSDLLDLNKLKQLGELLINYLSEILTFDNIIDIETLPQNEQLILSNGRNPGYWDELNPNSKDYPKGNLDPEYQKRKKKYDHYLKRFRELINKYNQNERQRIVIEIAKQKLSELLNLNYTTWGKLTDFLNQIERDNMGQINNSYKGLVSLKQYYSGYRYCLGCGKDISHQRKGTKFCIQSEVGYKPAHDCRNRFTNPHHNLKRRINKYNGYKTLFRTDELLRLTPEQQRLIEDYPNVII